MDVDAPEALRNFHVPPKKFLEKFEHFNDLAVSVFVFHQPKNHMKRPPPRLHSFDSYSHAHLNAAIEPIRLLLLRRSKADPNVPGL